MANVATCVFVLISFAFLSNVITEDTIKIEILKDPPKDCTRKASKGDTISMHYDGKLTNGKQFDSSYSRNQPFEFKLGHGMVISGWEQGVPGMCVGEKRKLTIPPSLAYGDRGFGDVIPPKSTLVFEIELIGIKGVDDKPKQKEYTPEQTEEEPEGGHEHPDSFEVLDTDGNKEISVEEMAAYVKKYHEAEAGESPEDSVDTIVGEIFQEDDKNKDGVISMEEYQHSASASDDQDQDEPMDGDEGGAEDEDAPYEEEVEEEEPKDEL